MKSIKQLLRVLHIQYILAKNGLDQVVVTAPLLAPLHFIIYFNPWNWFRKTPLRRGVALRNTLIELGPIFVKFGQALSTRPDILPPDIALELSELQDNVPPFSSEEALKIIEAAFGQSAFDLFAAFDKTPLASASMAQVHAATLKTGEDVVVKLLRPRMRKKIEQDISLLYRIAYLATRYWADSRRLKPIEIVREFEQQLLDELNLHREAANGAQLRRNFNDSPLLYVPMIYWDYVRHNVLVMERIYGIPITDIPTLLDNQIDLKKLAERGLEIFFTQVFRDCFFHADMHPGNIFVSYQHPHAPQYICVDFGIIGTLNDEDKRYLAENLLAFFNRDYRRVAQLHVESGWVARDTRIDAFESAIRTVCEPIFERPLKDISFAMLVLHLFEVARRFNMEVQPQLVLLQKTLLAIEGLGRQLYPELDLWATAKPFLEKWVREQIGPKALLRNIYQNIPFIVEQLPHMPRLLNEVLLLSKAQKIAQIDALPLHYTRHTPSKKRWQGVGVGIFLTMIGASALLHLHVLPMEQLTLLLLSTGVIGGFIAIINKG